MIELTPEQLAIVRGILHTHVPNCEVRAFGSRVGGKVKKYSDLDLAVVGIEKLSGRCRGALQEAFAESDLPFRVDVLDWQALADEFKQVIRKNYEVIQAAGPGAQHNHDSHDSGINLTGNQGRP